MGLELELKLLYHNIVKKGIFTLSVLIRTQQPKTLEETSPKQFWGKEGGGIYWPTNLSKLCRMEIMDGSPFKVILNKTVNEKKYEEYNHHLAANWI